VTDLLDVNVLVSLAWPNHLHHHRATVWFERRPGRSKWATTPITEAGFVRISSNRAAIPSAVSPVEAHRLLNRIRAVKGHVFLPDDVEQVTGDLLEPDLMLTHRLVTDAHLLAVARRHRARLVTLDRGITSLAGAPGVDVEVIQPA